jgi:hypothetical protein
MKRSILLLLVSLLVGHISHSQNDTVLYQKDSVIELSTDNTTKLIQEGEKIKSASKTFLVTKSKKTISLGSFSKSLGTLAEHALVDLDRDGKKELLIYNYTGGAHCCDEVYVFKNIATNKYQHVARLFAGNTTIDDSNHFYYDFHEQFGYFFTCFACSYEDSGDAAPISTTMVSLKYKKGVLTITRGDQELRSRINDNLAKLSEQPYQQLDDELQQDNGLRKEFALNLVVYYYSFGKNIIETQKLFNKYYKFPDAKKVWSEFIKTLNYVKKDSDI